MATSAKDAAQAIRDAKGFVTTAAKHLGISRVQLHNIIKAHPTVKEALDDAREEMKDFSEAQLFKNIRDGKETSLIFYLKCQAKDRGYVEKSQIEVIQKELNDTLDLLEKNLSPEEYERILTILANAG